MRGLVLSEPFPSGIAASCHASSGHRGRPPAELISGTCHRSCPCWAVSTAGYGSAAVAVTVVLHLSHRPVGARSETDLCRTCPVVGPPRRKAHFCRPTPWRPVGFLMTSVSGCGQGAPEPSARVAWRGRLAFGRRSAFSERLSGRSCAALSPHALPPQPTSSGAAPTLR